MFRDVRTPDDLARSSRKILEQRILTGREGHESALLEHLPRRRVEYEWTDLEAVREWRRNYKWWPMVGGAVTVSSFYELGGLNLGRAGENSYGVKIGLLIRLK